MKQFIAKLLMFVGSVLMFINFISIILLHLMFTIHAYQMSGLAASLTTFFLPLISGIYWLIDAWRLSGSFINKLSYPVLVTVGYLTLSFFTIYLSSLFEKKSHDQD